ncbi:MAG: hypothetical protein P9C48_05560 [Defluviicoccus sp.]|nr:hypothetical protein [Defluviicoccus sp.]MDG4608584.1 hypothetical protein [Defluviicoccus sp.]
MFDLTGSCHCGNIHVDVTLTRAPDEYTPRECDCEFCREHGASYISDPSGSLVISVNNKDLLRKYRQGSRIADMILCSNCGVLVGAICQTEDHFIAAINTKIIDGDITFGVGTPVSPKTLPADAKVPRWKKLWFSNVQFDPPAV